MKSPTTTVENNKYFVLSQGTLDSECQDVVTILRPPAKTNAHTICGRPPSYYIHCTPRRQP